MARPASWYVVQTQPNAERKALVHLERQGFATYLPRYTPFTSQPENPLG
jgi:hypothetical protein